MKATPHFTFGLAMLAATCLLALPASAQSAEGFDTSGIAPADLQAEPGADATPATAPAKAAAPAQQAPAGATPAPAAQEAAPVTKIPSRYAGSGPELDSYVNHYVAALSIKNRTTDPFGRYQDPEFKAPEPKIINSTKKLIPRAAPPMPFADVVASIQVNMVMAQKKSFMVSTPAGSRKLTQGNVFPIQLPSGKRVRVQVKAVTAAQIDFVNLDTGETAALKPDVMPVGMERGTKGITAPGMTPDGPNVPIEISPTSVPPVSSK